MSQLPIKPPFKIFVSAPWDSRAGFSASQRAVKNHILDMLRADGFEIELMGEHGMPISMRQSWDFETADKIMRCCQGALILGFPRWDGTDAYGYHAGLITEYSHVEGTLAYTRNLPILRIREAGVIERGILHDSEPYVTIPQNIQPNWLDNDLAFMRAYQSWSKAVKERFHVFFGYSGGARKVAQSIIKFLSDNGIRVRDWKEFQTAGTILQQIEKADRTCLGGIFLFSKDDALTKNAATVNAAPLNVPRDNVVFEAGYFINSKGETKVQIIVEDGVNLLDDVVGQIYLPLKKRTSLAQIKDKLLRFVADRVSHAEID